MSSTNGHGSKKAILYARVSTEEQARTGYSLAQQLEALQEFSAQEGYEVLEEVKDPGQSGASLERPGIDRVRDLVSAGGVSVVLAQDRDRFAREPAYLYLLREELRERGCSLRALNDKGDDSPEGELTDGLLDQIARYERAKIAQRTQRGKLRRAREGKIVAVTSATYGFEYNEARDNYMVNEEKMVNVRRIFFMVGVEGRPINAVKVAFDREGVPTPGAAAYWSKKTIRDVILNDSYKPHDTKEIASLVAEGLLSVEVAETLNPSKRYGIWWFNRMRVRRKQTSEMGPDGPIYRRRAASTEKPREKWVAVPIPAAEIPLVWVDGAREAIKDNRPISSAGRRLWPLSGGVLLCGGCGRRMFPNVSGGHNGRKKYVYYRCPKRIAHGQDACTHRKQYRAEKVEAAAWNLVSGLLTDPTRLRAALAETIKQERQGLRGDPDRDRRIWLSKLTEADRKRSRYQEMAAEGLIDFDELRAKLATLEETRKTARRELEALESRDKKLAELECNSDALLERYTALVPEALEVLDAEERHQLYNMLRLRVTTENDGALAMSGVLSSDQKFSEQKLTSPFTNSRRSTVLERQKHA